jgi:hypothetical protein
LSQQGPNLDALLHRLAECPEDFLVQPHQAKKDGVHVDALVFDLLSDLGMEDIPLSDLAAFRSNRKARRGSIRLALVGCWLLHDSWFRGRGDLGPAALQWLRDGLVELAELVTPETVVADADRREELVRACLAALKVRPAGETKAQAKDRLKSLSSVERARVIRATRAKHERARRLREEMEAERAREAAARYTRE